MSYSPPPLQIGDKVAITATARKISLAELAPAIDLLKTWGLVPVIGDSIDRDYQQFAGTDEQRAAALQRFLDDPDIKAIWFARGGYGTARIIDQLDWSVFCRHPKWLVGYSDTTALQSHVWQCLQISSLHATLSSNVLKNTEQSLSTLRQALMGQSINYTPLLPNPLNRVGVASGELVGGNLSVLYSIVATPSDLQPQQCLLFLEDLDEYLYHIDRMMLALRRSGKLAQLSGLIIGGMTDMRDNAIPFGKNAYEIIAEHVQNYSYPVLFGFSAGHIANNQTLVIGGNHTMTVQSNAPCTLFLNPTPPPPSN